MRSTRGRIRAGTRALAAAVAVASAAAALAGCIPIKGGGPRPPTSSSAAPAVPSGTPAPEITTAAPSGTPDPSVSHLATPEPEATPRPAPTLTPVPKGTVVAEADAVSPKGSIRFHYRVVANGDDTYSIQYSGFTSTVPVPVSATLIDVPPKVGDGLTWHGVGDHELGGPTSSPGSSSAPLGTMSRPDYLTTLVIYSSAPSGDGVPVELGPNKVLAVSTIEWSIPVRQSNVHPVDGGTRAYAAGTVTGTTASGAPRRYLVAPGDVASTVAARFGISLTDLIWLNANLQVFGSAQYLYEGTRLNLDPNAR